MIDEFAVTMCLVVVGLVLTGIGAVIWSILFGQNEIDQEIREAMDRLEAEERRYRIGEIDRRNLAQ